MPSPKPHAELRLERFLPYRLSVLSNRVSQDIARLYSARFNLSITEWRVMAVLGHERGLSANTVAERTAMDKVAVSRAVSALMDTCCGAAVMCHPENGGGTATIDLRIDYMRPATPNLDIFCRAHCYRMTRRIAFIRGEVFQDDPDKPIAYGTGSFMINANDTAPLSFADKSDLSKDGSV